MTWFWIYHRHTIVRLRTGGAAMASGRLGQKTRAILVERFPKTFVPQGTAIPKRPLKIGISHDLRKRCPDLSSEAIACALSDYTRGSKYLDAMVVGAERVDLDGNPVGYVQDADVRYATLKANRQARHNEMRAKIRHLTERVAKLEQALRRAQVYWCCLVRGPGDAIPTPDYASALQMADTINRNDLKNELRAVPARWPGSADEHAIVLHHGNEAYAWADFPPAADSPAVGGA